MASHYLKQWWPSLLTHLSVTQPQWFKGEKQNTLRLAQNGWHFAIDIFKCSFLKYIYFFFCILIRISLKSAPRGPIDNESLLVQVMVVFCLAASYYLNQWWPRLMTPYRADSRFAPSQWETALLCNDVSHWLGVNLETALPYGVTTPWVITLNNYDHPW